MNNKRKRIFSLFNSLLITGKQTEIIADSRDFINKFTLPNGFIFADEIFQEYSKGFLLDFIDFISELYPDGNELNKSFHQSWAKVRNSPLEELVIEQLLHYATTYGLQRIGLANDDLIYMPQKITNDIPEIDIDKFPIKIISGITISELIEKIKTLTNSGIALQTETIDNLYELFVGGVVDNDSISVNSIKNKELKIRLCDLYNVVPESAEDFLRYVIYKTTGETLIIKNRNLIDLIKEHCKSEYDAQGFFNLYISLYSISNLAEIFYRYKPLFLAFRADKSLRPIINKIRKLAYKYHTPMCEDYINSITKKVTQDIVIDPGQLNSELEKVNIFRHIRLLYTLNNQVTNTSGKGYYQIRNGKSFIKDKEYKNLTAFNFILDIVKDSLIKKVSKKVDGKIILVPEKLHYALPTSEKQFMGNIPFGSHIIFKDQMVFGVHWKNQHGCSTDLDLSIISAEGKIGWDSSYRIGVGQNTEEVLFSGDVTDAPHGASELLYIKNNVTKPYLVSLNWYNPVENEEAKYNLFFANEQIDNLTSNYMVNPNNIIFSTNLEISKQQVIGLIMNEKYSNKYFFINSANGNSISSGENEKTEGTREYLFSYYKNIIGLNEILRKSGALLITDSKDKDIDIDLSPENLSKDTIINLLKD